MDQEEEEALELTKDELLAMAARGEDVQVADDEGKGVTVVDAEGLDSIVIEKSTFLHTEQAVEQANVVNELRLLCAVCRASLDPLTVYQHPVPVPSGRQGLVYGHEKCIVGDYVPLQPQGRVLEVGMDP